MIKKRVERESNYSAIFVNGKTLRMPLDPKKDIVELKYPEFYDVKITGKCKGNCQGCYMDSTEDQEHYDALNNLKKFFEPMTPNQRPFQIAYGGGEPTLHPDFCSILEYTHSLGIVPNYTTNGMFIYEQNAMEILEATKKYSMAVALSCHSHLDSTWMQAVEIFFAHNVKTNFHIIISDKTSIDRFLEIYKIYKGKVLYFVLLPLTAKGRCKEAVVEHEYLFENLSQINQLKEFDGIKDVAFGANFYPMLKETKYKFDLSLYEPELLSKFLDVKDNKIYKSSFAV
jgi:organic radical activating enzyme